MKYLDMAQRLLFFYVGLYLGTYMTLNAFDDTQRVVLTAVIYMVILFAFLFVKAVLEQWGR